MQVLRTTIAKADGKGKSLFLHFTKPKKEDIKTDAINLDLNKLMQNVGSEQFDYGMFKAAFDTDPRIKTMVSNFSQKGIEAKTANTIKDTPQGGDQGGDAVADMAKSATDVGDSLI